MDPVRAKNQRTNHQYSNLITNLAIERGQDITVSCMPAHSSIDGNERTDVLAEQGTNRYQVDIKLSSLADSYIDIEHFIKQQHQQTWNTMKAAFIETMPKIDHACQFTSQGKEDITSRLQLGRCGHN